MAASGSRDHGTSADVDRPLRALHGPCACADEPPGTYRPPALRRWMGRQRHRARLGLSHARNGPGRCVPIRVWQSATPTPPARVECRRAGLNGLPLPCSHPRWSRPSACSASCRSRLCAGRRTATTATVSGRVSGRLLTPTVSIYPVAVSRSCIVRRLRTRRPNWLALATSS